jgi:hypothetical protein
VCIASTSFSDKRLSYYCVCVCVLCCVVLCVLCVLLYVVVWCVSVSSSLYHYFRSTWGSFDDFNKRNSQSPSRSLSSSSQTFPKTLQDFIQQKQWERFDVETEQKRVRTAHTQRLRAERYANKYGLDLEKHVKKLFPTKSRSKEELQALPHHKAPKSIRMTTKYVPPITKLKYVFINELIVCDCRKPSYYFL